MKRYFYYVAMIAITLSACNKSSDKTNDIQLPNAAKTDQMTDENKEEEHPQFNGQFNLADTVGQSAITGSPSQVPGTSDWDKKIIKTADLQLELKEYEKFSTSFHNSIKRFGAYIASEKQQRSDYKIENTVVIKVPVEQFDDFVNSFAGEGIKIIEKDITGEDVTGEYIDTRSRLQAKLEVREKYLQLLKQAKNMKEILDVQNEINEIQEEIEAAEGRINYLKHSAAYSTVNIDYYQYINGTTSDNKQPGFFTRVAHSFAEGASTVGELFLFIVSVWPFLLGIIIFWVFIKRFRLKKA
ncbi:MAG: DUF4349 domain-containing protein [Bacteroidetes bacterium]|nr:DUF4349 domain-containing protein [Bacteroidota bacterium]